MISFSGEITQNYYMVKSMNEELHAMNGVFLNYDNKGIIINKLNDNWTNSISKELCFDEFYEFKSIKSDSSILIGCFEKGAKKGLYVVNCEYNVDANAAVELTFDSKFNFKVWGASGVEFFNKVKFIQLELISGEGKFIEFCDVSY